MATVELAGEYFLRLLSGLGDPKIRQTEDFQQRSGVKIYTSDAFIGVLKHHEISISMDGRGRALDNIFIERFWRSVKYEDIYLKEYRTVPELKRGISEYFRFYNAERFHQSLGYQTPDAVYASATGGGACIVDKYSQKKASDKSSEATRQQEAAA